MRVVQNQTDREICGDLAKLLLLNEGYSSRPAMHDLTDRIGWVLRLAESLPNPFTALQECGVFRWQASTLLYSTALIRLSAAPRLLVPQHVRLKTTFARSKSEGCSAFCYQDLSRLQKQGK